MPGLRCGIPVYGVCNRDPGYVPRIGDDADAGDQRVVRILDLTAAAFAEHLPHRFVEVETAAGEAGLARGNLTAAGVERQRAVESQVSVQREVAAVPGPAGP